jgi:hypothetical protein
MSFTGRLRNYGRFHSALGAGFAVFLVLFIIGFAGGFYAGVKNANSSKLAKGKELLSALKSKE